jgi:hypothetical protein
MSDNIFDKEVENASAELLGSVDLNQLDLTPEMEDQLRQVEALAQMDPSFANSKEYKDLMTAVADSQQASDDDDEQEEDEEEEGEGEEEDDDDIFGITKSKKDKGPILNFEPQKELIDFMNSHYGIKDAEKFFSSVDTWRNQAQEGSEVKKEYDALSTDLQAMPPEIKMAVQLWAEGNDYMSAFEMSQRLDFSDIWENQTPEGLVQQYFPEEYNELMNLFDKGQLDESDYEDKLILLAKTTKRVFTEDKQALDLEREEFINRQKNEHQMMRKSALLSVENLSKAYPNFSKSEINKIRGILVEGKVDNLFVNSDGSYNEEAAELVAYAVYGKKMLESVKKIAERQGESKANQKIVDLSPKAIKKQKGTGTNQPMNLQAVGHLNGLFKNDPYA